jgi:hypothetical protein
MMRKQWILFAVLPVLLRCSPAEHSLVGEWSGNHPQGGANILLFRANGTAEWRFDNPQMSKTNLRYTIDYSTTPHHIQISGFDHGPLQGLVMHGILEFPCPNRFRLDLEPALPADDPDEIRPKAFGDDTREYRRKLSASERTVHRKEGGMQ